MRERLIMIFLVLILAALGFAVFEKEQLKHHGDVVLLELAPADPRSLIQGDYMRLRYRLNTTKVFREMIKNQADQELNYIIVKVDKNRVAQLARPDRGEPLARDERRLRVQKRDHYKIVPDSFLFQEGHAQHYDEARYGVFRVEESGKNLLVDLADKEYKVIDPSSLKDSEKSKTTTP